MITMEEGLQSYRIYAQAAGRSPRTIEWVIRSVRYLMDFLGDNSRYCDQVTANDLRRFIIESGRQYKYENHPYNPKRDEFISFIRLWCLY